MLTSSREMTQSYRWSCLVTRLENLESLSMGNFDWLLAVNRNVQILSLVQMHVLVLRLDYIPVAQKPATAKKKRRKKVFVSSK